MFMMTRSMTRNASTRCLDLSPKVPSTVPNSNANVIIPKVFVPSLKNYGCLMKFMQ